jgi:hypothetical protein
MNNRKLLKLQMFLAKKLGFKIDLYHQEDKGVLAVRHGDPLVPENVVFHMDEWTFNRF